MVAEAKALLLGFCSDHNISPNFIESDSKMLVQVMLSHISTPWAISYIINQCQLLLSPAMKIQHAYREGNAVADRLAFEAHSHTGTIFYWSDFALPTNPV